MKRHVILLMIIAAMLTGCKKEGGPKNNRVTVTDESVRDIDPTRVEISGAYSYPSDLDAIYVLVSGSSDMADASAFESVLSGKSFTADVTGLKENTNYYYRYRFVSMGTEQESEAVKSFTTATYGVPVVITAEVTNIMAATATCGGEVTYGGGFAVTERGVCWSTSPNPTISDSHTTDGGGTGVFTSSITGLTENTTYYVRAYATNSVGMSYGEQKSFTTTTLHFTVNGVTFEMVAVKGGTFTMGATPEQGGDADDDERPAHSVTLDDYYIGKFEVTQELWEAVMGSNPSYFYGSNLPVERVSWNDCQEFITKLNGLTGKNFRLPTEAEWEYAARGGNRSGGYKYSGSNSISEVAWYYDNSSRTHPAGTKSPNELGIYDMSGNVYEWCQDWYGSYGSGSQTNPTGPSSASYRVDRGGGWDFNARVCRVSYRSSRTPAYRNKNLGLRLAL